MAKLYELTDGYAPEETIDGLPVEPALPTDRPRVVINTAEFDKPKEEKPSAYENLTKGIKNLLGLGEEERYQLWPEKVVREGLTAAGDIAKPNPYAEGSEQWYEYERLRQDAMVPAAMSISALAGSGGLASKGGSLNATPSLRPALKYKEKLYKGKPGQEHQDIIPKELYDDFSRKAMSGEDLAEYNFGFVNDKGHFLNREDALKYGIDTGIIDPHSGRFGALTTTLMADSSKPGAAIEAVGKSQAPAFYSAVEHTVNNIPQSKMTGDQWLGTLSNKPGVKPEELDWTGLKSFLEENKGKPVTKSEIEQHLAANKVELKEVVKGEEKTLNQRIEEYKNKGFDQSEAEIRAYADRDATNFQNTKYHSYQLPGGENYREMLLTLPNSKYDAAKVRAREIEKRINKIQDEFDDLNLLETLEKAPANIAEQRAKLADEFDTLTKERREFTMPEAGYKSSHWDEPNILAHVRMNDRNIDGKKSLHLEEIQSDWHQQGRDRGYKQGVQEIKGFKPEELKLEKGEYDWSGISPDGRSAKVGQGVAKTEQEARDYLTRHLNKLAAEKNSAARIAESDKLPDAPFKKTWHELALKRMIKEAAEKGYDRLSWTPGEAQATRYSLEKQLKELQYLKNEDGTYEIAGVLKDGGGFNHPQSVPASKLPDIVGKEMAEKIIKNEGKRARGHPANGGYFEGVDLKVGGEGMKGFYDQIIPKALEKLGKEHGVKVKKAELGGKTYEQFKKEMIENFGATSEKDIRKTYDDLGYARNPPQPIFYIDIPQSLKDTALRKGFPLFSNAHPGFTFIPVQGNPFENSK